MARPKQILVPSGTEDHVLQLQANNACAAQRLTLETFLVAGLPAATTARQLVYVSDEAGGAVPAFSDGTNWRRVTDRTIVS